MTAEQILKQNFGDDYHGLEYSVSAGKIIAAMKMYAEMEREKAFEAARKQHKINYGDRHRDDYESVNVYATIEEYKTQNPLT